jgi:hypothetical protein
MTKYICHGLSNTEWCGACGWGLAVGFWVSCEWKPRKEWWGWERCANSCNIRPDLYGGGKECGSPASYGIKHGGVKKRPAWLFVGESSDKVFRLPRIWGFIENVKYNNRTTSSSFLLLQILAKILLRVLCFCHEKLTGFHDLGHLCFHRVMCHTW